MRRAGFALLALVAVASLWGHGRPSAASRKHEKRAKRSTVSTGPELQMTDWST